MGHTKKIFVKKNLSGPQMYFSKFFVVFEIGNLATRDWAGLGMLAPG
jgi:hypothetical protein